MIHPEQADFDVGHARLEQPPPDQLARIVGGAAALADQPPRSTRRKERYLRQHLAEADLRRGRGVVQPGHGESRLDGGRRQADLESLDHVTLRRQRSDTRPEAVVPGRFQQPATHAEKPRLEVSLSRHGPARWLIGNHHSPEVCGSRAGSSEGRGKVEERPIDAVVDADDLVERSAIEFRKAVFPGAEIVALV